jgi:tRNA dimethylallyltransferase
MVELENVTPQSVVVIAGPTASGKSGLALELAQRYNGVIINADSMQVYQGTPILSAVPDAQDRALVEHRLYEIFAPNEGGSVAEWLKLAVAAIRDVWQQGKLPIVVGGTGFYIESLINGTSPIPETSVAVKQKVGALLAENGVEKLWQMLHEKDAAGAELVKPTDTTRVRRAYEILEDTGCSIAMWHTKPLIRLLPEAEFTVVALLPKLSELEEKCALRFDLMMQQGALNEVKNLLALGLPADLPAMKAIGVPELSAFLRGEITLDEAVCLAKLHTRQYAKRQLTWFRNRLAKLSAKVVYC